eukprot:TRINITY_DN15496_c0_g1_i1.p1 TRINITY_DN15496_c0_g1~~TRINITY_DN15496_c0_g1_i1.p1  ORF type:complete len:592 (+),score=153.41 TRINITY_DN15496_c0_g1_i1:118-1893(+)
MIRRPPRSTLSSSSAASDVYKRQVPHTPGAEVNIAELKASLKQKLPEYMVPSAFVVMSALPLTANQKVNRRALPNPDWDAQRGGDGADKVMPRTRTEQLLAEIWKEALGLSQVPGVSDNFFELGGHSLTAASMIARASEVCGVTIPLSRVFAAPTVEGLAAAAQALQSGNNDPAADSQNLEAEIVLPSCITAEGLAPRLEGQSSEFKTILLTGATGFLGAFLLYELLQRTNHDVLCLVRAKNSDNGMERLRRSLEGYGLWEEVHADRIIPVVGDLGLPRFGLSEHQWTELATDVHEIFHSASYVNFMFNYDALKAANVGGAVEVLSLATTVCLKPVHFISTLSTYGHGAHLPQGPIREDAPLAPYTQLFGGYTQSKWVAERIAMIAQQRGVPLSIYRPGRITGHSKSGAGNSDDFMCRMIKGCIQLHKYPELTWEEKCAPVDYCAQAIVEVAKREDSLGRNYHLIHSEPFEWSDMFKWVAEFGFDARPVLYEPWRNTLVELGEQGRENAMYALLPLLSEVNDDSSSRMPEFDCSNLTEMMAETGIRCPAMDKELLFVYLAYFVKSGFLDAPSCQSRLAQGEVDLDEEQLFE